MKQFVCRLEISGIAKSSPFLQNQLTKKHDLNLLYQMQLEEKLNYFCIEVKDGLLLDFRAIFGNDNPITLEIGSGKGEFLAIHSRVHRERNFIGVELRTKRIHTILKKIDAAKHSNVRLLNIFVDENVTKIIPPESIDEIIIYHPDPWPKTRHHKRRLFQNTFLESIKDIIKVGGFIRISTDSYDYVLWIKALFDKRNDFISIYDEGYTRIIPEDHFWTYFDEEQSQVGYEPIFMLYKKIK
jgi:tRNA (guanine-N7-)-methyltransferase